MRYLDKLIFKRLKYLGGCLEGGYLSFDLIDLLFFLMKLFFLIVYNIILLNLNVEFFDYLYFNSKRKLER